VRTGRTAISCRILVFAKAPTPGRVKTRLTSALGERAAAELHRQLVVRTLRTATAAAVGPVDLWCAPDAQDAFFVDCAEEFGLSLHDQAEGDLGMRMAHALEIALTDRAPALLIGSDCPALTAQYLRDAAAACSGDDHAVFGPAEDGGYVLIGLARIPPAHLFENMPWGSATVMQETRLRLEQLGWRWVEMPPLWDVDRPEDLPRLRQFLAEQ
jgi:rSAM/selenodomain-associated transferase 1